MIKFYDVTQIESGSLSLKGLIVKTIFIMTLLLFSFPSLAVNTGSLLLKGQVQEILDIVVTPEAIAASLPLTISQTGTKVATVTERSNASLGYRVKMVSANLSQLKRTDGTEVFPYYITYNNLPVNLIDTQTYSYHDSAAVVVDRDIKIFYTGVPAENMVAGEYTDTITFTISIN